MQSNVTEAKSIDKFIAFFDVLGWKSLVRRTEQNNNGSLTEVVDVLDMIRREVTSRKELLFDDGSKVCPSALSIKQDIDFCFTMFSDNVVISTEVSPAGLVNLIDCCRAVYFKLIMRKGLMCRGYVDRGPIYHSDDYCVGTGLSDVVSGEKEVSIFQIEDGEVGTPFIEIDRSVIHFIDEAISDSCVIEVLKDAVKRQEDVAAIFPFKGLDPGKFGSIPLDPPRVRRDANVVRRWIEDANRIMARNVDPNCSNARRKERCLIQILDTQLSVCNQADILFGQMSEVFPFHSFSPEYFPGLFDDDIGAELKN